MAWTQPGPAVCVRAGARGRVSLAHACPPHQCLGSGPGRRLLKASQGESQLVKESLTAWWKEVLQKTVSLPIEHFFLNISISAVQTLEENDLSWQSLRCVREHQIYVKKRAQDVSWLQTFG
ncbi:uncharacterized protein LOC116069864 isoform X2 [Mastomys coucha]|uniref:uncharacterized protein LOC116069864 isoform X2 n=1 Tax=Mastomys coucha TaxID=35658 RepID=UPI00126253F1|nr:uncharacterized protein LOC116069864 isoform X2 [Mastomys coucha]